MNQINIFLGNETNVIVTKYEPTYKISFNNRSNDINIPGLYNININSDIFDINISVSFRYELSEKNYKDTESKVMSYIHHGVLVLGYAQKIYINYDVLMNNFSTISVRISGDNKKLLINCLLELLKEEKQRINTR